MKPFFKKNIHSLLFVLSITFFGIFLAIILNGHQTENQKLGSYLGMGSMFLVALSLFLAILKANKRIDD